MLLLLTSQPLLPGLFQLPPYGLSNSILSLMPSHLPGPGLFLSVYSLPCKHISRASPQSRTKTPNNRLLLICKAKSSLLSASHGSASPCKHFPALFHTDHAPQPSQFTHCPASISHHAQPLPHRGPHLPLAKCSKPQSSDHSFPSKLKSQFLLMPSLTRGSSPDKCFLYISLVFTLIVHKPSLNEELSEGFS